MALVFKSVVCNISENPSEYVCYSTEGNAAVFGCMLSKVILSCAPHL